MKKAQIGELFDIVYGQRKYHNKEWLEGDEGQNILISSKGEENGVYGFYNIENKFKAPVITVQGYGTIGQAFVQEYDCSVDDHLLVLIPKEKMEIFDLYQVAYQIRLEKWKYKYGRGITPSRLETQIVYIQDLEKKSKELEKRITPIDTPKEEIIENKNIVWQKLTDLCNVDRKYYFYLNQINLDEDKTPYVTTTEKNNGVSVFCGEEAIAQAKQITIALDGKCGEAFFQIVDFISGEKTAILNSENKYLLIYIGACIKILSWKFHYGRKLSMSRLKNMEIPVPFKENKIDLEYIEKIVKNSYGFEFIASEFSSQN